MNVVGRRILPKVKGRRSPKDECQSSPKVKGQMSPSVIECRRLLSRSPKVAQCCGMPEFAQYHWGQRSQVEGSIFHSLSLLVRGFIFWEISISEDFGFKDLSTTVSFFLFFFFPPQGRRRRGRVWYHHENITEGWRSLNVTEGHPMLLKPKGRWRSKVSRVKVAEGRWWWQVERVKVDGMGSLFLFLFLFLFFICF